MIKNGLNKKLLCALLALLFIVMLAFNFMTPLLGDDFSYAFNYAEKDLVRMESVSQIPESMRQHRLEYNGRVIVHGIVQLFMLMPKAVFNIFNSVNVLLIVFLFSRYLRRDTNYLTLLLSLGAFLVWNYLPVFGKTFLWLDGSVNYSWGISVYLTFMLPYVLLFTDREHSAKTWLKVFFVLFAFVAGSYSENGSLAILFAAACLSVLIIIRDRKLPLHLILAFVLALAGYVFLMSAPATATRAGTSSLFNVAVNVKQIAEYARGRLLAPMIIFAVSFVWAAVIGGDRKKLTVSAVIFLAGLGSLASFSFAAYFAPRHCCVTVIFTVLASLINFDVLGAAGRKEPAKLIAAAAAVLFAFNFVLGSLDIGRIYLDSRAIDGIMDEARAAGEKTIEVPIYDEDTEYCASGAMRLNRIEQCNVWPNNTFAAYYGFDTVIGVDP